MRTSALPRSLFFVPPLPRRSGGVAVILRLAGLLHRAGFPVALAPREASAELPDPDLCPGVPVLPREELGPGDLWVTPEGWPRALLPGLQAGARCVVYVQNWAYLLGNLPDDAAWKTLPVRFLAVSRPVAWFVEQAVGRRSELLRPGIDPALFHPDPARPADAPVQGPLRVA